jgi:hypothetical protein
MGPLLGIGDGLERRRVRIRNPVSGVAQLTNLSQGMNDRSMGM